MRLRPWVDARARVILISTAYPHEFHTSVSRLIMGTFFQSIALPHAAPEEVRRLLCRWLAGKGFEQRSELPLFECDDDSERGLCLFSNDRWVIVLYSHIDAENERLLFELAKLQGPILETWVHDSDLWGYDLFQQGELAASFNSNPNYFEVSGDADSLRAGDPELICQYCPATVGPETIARIQRGRAVFKELICRHFCAALGAPPAGMGYRDIEEYDVASTAAVSVGGFQMEQLFFVNPYRAEQDTAPRLHSLTFQPAEPPQEIPAELQAYIRAWQLWARILAVLIQPFLYALGILFRLYLRWPHLPWLHRWFDSLGSLPEDLVDRDLRNLPHHSCRLDGRRLINDRHRCAVTLPEGAEPVLFASLHWAFHFRFGDVAVFCEAIRPGRVRSRFRLPIGTTVVEDENFFAGELLARAIALRMSQQIQDEGIITYQYLVQTDRAFYGFSASPGPAQQLDEATRASLREIVSSFQQVA